MDVLNIVYSLPFLLGAAAGLALDRLYKCLRAHWLNEHYPLPDGAKHHAGGFNRTYVGAVIAAAVLGYVLLTVGNTENRYKSLAAEVQACQAINAQNDDLSVKMRDLFLNRDELESIWLKRIIAPDNPEIASLDPQDERRQAWATDVTIVYNERAAELNKQIRAISDQQVRLANERNDNPTCRPADNG